MTRHYFFDLKGEVRKRDHAGTAFADPADAIRHGDLKAWTLAMSNARLVSTDCYIAVTEENGREIHRTPLARISRSMAA
jgi:hypothetical protein